jgi:hypothetical protein
MRHHLDLLQLLRLLGLRRRSAHVYPSSTVVEGLDVSKWTTTINDKYFDRKKGKGLVVKEPISEGQTVWKEDPFNVAPEW